MTTPSNSPYTPDLRGFIEFLEKEHPEHVVRIKKEVDPKFGVSGILERLERDGKFPLVIFENVKGSTDSAGRQHACELRAAAARARHGDRRRQGVRQGMRGAAGQSDRSGDGRERAGARGGVPRQGRERRGPADLHLSREGRGQVHHRGARGDARSRDRHQQCRHLPAPGAREEPARRAAFGDRGRQHHLEEIREARPALPGRHRHRAPSGVLRRLAVLLDARLRRDQDRRRHAAAAGAAGALQDHSARGAGQRRDRAGVRNPPGGAAARSAVRRISRHLRAAAHEPGAGDQGDHAAEEPALPERLRRPRRQPAAVGADPHELHRGDGEDRLPDRARRERAARRGASASSATSRWRRCRRARPSSPRWRRSSPIRS